jgi:hypothetical protein
VNADGIDGGACFCMTKLGYFPGANNRAQACDVDGDGWVTSAARVVLEDTRPNVKENGRCDLRRVSSFELRPEVGAVTRVSLDAPLPLYESPRNDGASSDHHADYGSSAPMQLAPAHLNSLTKACVAPSGDYNDDDVLDVTEAQDMEPGLAVEAGLRAYYAQYVRFTYFLELHNGWYVAGETEGEPGTYVIAERSRLDPVLSRGVGLQHPAPSEYWRSCGRHDDLLYSSDPASLVGADFAGRSMHHHSQFKCVVGSSLTDYGGSSASVRPWSVFSGGGSSVGWVEAGTLLELGQSNACNLTGESYSSEGGLAVNPKFPGISCDVADLDTSGTIAQWVVVDYLNAGPSEDQAGDPEYRRGCINECAELGVAACPTYVEGAGAGFICDMSVDDAFGQIRCGCDGNFSGPGTLCMMGCANSGATVQHFTSPGFAIYDREHSGYWMCLDPSLTSTGIVAGDGYVLRGHLPLTVTGGTRMTGDGYVMSNRQRLEVHTRG